MKTKKNRGSKKKATAKKASPAPNELKNEIIAIAIIAFSIFLFLSVFTNKMGIAGQILGGFLKGMLGIGGYIAPFVVVGYCFSYFVKKNKKLNLIASLIFVLIVMTFLHVLYYIQWDRAGELNTYYSLGDFANGGLMGALLGDALFKVFGLYGAYIFLLVASLILLIIVTGKSIFTRVGLFLAGLKPEKEIKKVKKQDGILISIHNEEKLEPITEPLTEKQVSALFSEKSSEPAIIMASPKEYTKARWEMPERDELIYRKENIHYVYPPIDLLQKNNSQTSSQSKGAMLQSAKKLEETLLSFGVEAKVLQINKGPTVTRYELAPNQGVKVSKIVGLADDIALNLAASGIRIEAPIPGKAAVGIEVPNKDVQSVFFREVIEDEAFSTYPSKLAVALGKDISGSAVITDIAKMPHLLIAGATGSGKSVCINTLISSIIYKASPDEVKLLMIDPKVVELSVYNGIPHLLIPVVTDAKKAAGALKWAVEEMLERYKKFARRNVREIKGYNQAAGDEDYMPHIVIIIDELADLMMAAPKDVEDSICRLAQMARAAGIHLIIATQRPSVDVITGLIKANIPSRLAFAVSSGTDSRTILDSVGAEKLLGKGDMLFYPAGMAKPQRIQGAFISDKEVEHIVEFVKPSTELQYDEEMIKSITGNVGGAQIDDDALIMQAIDLIVEKGKASVSMLQRQFKIGYKRAVEIMEELESKGVIGPEDGSKRRKVLVTPLEWNHIKNKRITEDSNENRY